MGKNPYSDLPNSAFWKTGVAQENPYAIEGIYKKKFKIPPNAKIATAGSCFAQHISRHLKKNGYNVLDVEPPPPGLPDELHQKFGFSMYSARYGNIYTVRQLLQLAQEVAGEWSPQDYIWEKNGKFYDALRPAVEPEGLNSPEEVVEQRKFHISRLKELFESLDLFIFTLGLTEMWVHKESGTVYPTAPGTLVGEFDDHLYEFQNAQFSSIIYDFNRFQKILTKIRGGKPFKCLLTVSPVPLTATASGNHVLASTVYSKATLRSVAGQLSSNQAHIDYFPSYEIVINPRMHSSGFADNLRSVRDETVETVMRHFFAEHASLIDAQYNNIKSKDLQCEEALLDAFSGDFPEKQSSELVVEVLGNSHLGGFKRAFNANSDAHQESFFFYPNNWMIKSDFVFKGEIPKLFNADFFQGEYRERLRFPVHTSRRKKFILVGLGMFGDGIIRRFGILSTNLFLSMPIVATVNDIDKKVIEDFEFHLLLQRKRVERLKILLRSSDLVWVSSPMPSETCAVERFGIQYVESRSQRVYNEAYSKIAQRVLGDFVSDGTILLQSDHTISETGFTKDHYRLDEHAQGIHASPEYYDEIIKANCDVFL
ncbi:GSCFA domain-containing protein [bacterium]|nr:GSCFA domain-containing protein [bacterium]